ncbi:Arv1 protein [Globomyces pollinis-pini]|nr:Arv1 protein [Globomyces pollinis-pini]
MICIECGAPITQLYIEYGKGSIRLTQCGVCQEFADKYQEYDFVILCIDMTLLKSNAYRHVIFNRLKYNHKGTNDVIVRLGILLILFEVYMKWFQLDQIDEHLVYSDFPVYIQYLYVLTICVLEFLVYHGTIRLMAGVLQRKMLSLKQSNRLSMALTLSSFGKLLLIVMVVWDYGRLNPTSLINFFVFICNFNAVSVTLQMNFFAVCMIMTTATLLKLLFQLTFAINDPALFCILF